MSSKRYRGKDCAYCGKKGISTEGDHVIAREFFFVEDRGNLPQVPTCRKCNSTKSALETYVSAALMVGSNLAEGSRYRKEMVRPRLNKNRRLTRDLGINRPPVWMNVDGLIRPLHMITLDTDQIKQLMAKISQGLYNYHFGKPLSSDFYPEVITVHPAREREFWGSIAHLFPAESPRVQCNWGRGTFIYEGAQSVTNQAVSAWRMTWHNGIPLHGVGSPPEGVKVFWSITCPTTEAVAKEKVLVDT